MYSRSLIRLSFFAILCLFGAAYANEQDKVLITQAKDSFEAAYVHTGTYSDYIIAVEVSTLEIQKAFHNFSLSHDENWADYCLSVALGLPIPSSLAALLPASFMEFRVFYRVQPKAPEDDVICTMDAYICADGTVVGRTGPNCEFVCPNTNGGDTPTGGLSLDEVETVEEDFFEYYGLTAPYDSYVEDLYVSTLESQKLLGYEIYLTDSESWSDYCIVVLCYEMPPTTLDMPKVYKGVRVFYTNETTDYCTDDAMICPDGSVVGRIGPMCDFAPCPPPSSSHTVIAIPGSLVFILSLVACCACLRKRRKNCRCNNKCAANGFQPLREEPQAQEHTTITHQQEQLPHPYMQTMGMPVHPAMQVPMIAVPVPINNGYPMYYPPFPQQQQQQQ